MTDIDNDNSDTDEDGTGPSFLIIHLKNTADIPYLEHSVAAQLSWPGQSLLTLLKGPGRNPREGVEVVLSRAAYKKLLMLQGGTDAAVISMLKRVPGVENARIVPGAFIRNAMVNGSNAARQPAGPGPGQWYLDTIRARRAWSLLGASPDTLPWGDIKVGHIDTGITEHPVFFNAAGSSWVRWDRGINFKEPGRLPVDPLSYDGYPGHGTRTSSVLAGRAAAEPFSGVAPGVTVIPYRITNTVVIDFLNNDTQIARALKHAVFDAGCHVLSISLGDPCLPAEGAGAMIDAAYDSGVIVVAAAGNVTSEVTYPGRFSRVITAGGSTRMNTPWQGGSRGLKVDLSAPADEIHRADAILDKDKGTTAYVYGGGGDGTSYATAMIAGAAALWRAFHAGALATLYPQGWQIVEAFRQCARRSATVPQGWPTTEYGAGILNVEALLRHPLPPPASLVYQSRLAANERF